MSDFSNLSALQLDALKEIGNIGSGNAANALSLMLNKKIDITIPQIKIIPLEKVPDTLGGPENIVVGILLRVEGSAPGSVMFLLPEKQALDLVDMLMAREKGTSHHFGELEQSALKEVGNILTASYLNALDNFTRLSLSPSVPAIAKDMLGSIISIVLAEIGQFSDYALLIETEFIDGEDGINSQFFLVPEPDSLSIILESLGIG